MANNHMNLVHVAMNIILHAGDARFHVNQALSEAKMMHFTQADQFLFKAQEQLKQAHQAQTEIIQAEANGHIQEVNLLFIHAQDTLMTIMSEVALAEQIIDFFKITLTKIQEATNHA